MDARQIQKALWHFKHWYLEIDNSDELLAPYLSEQISPARFGWVGRARKALHLSMGEVAKRMQVSRASYAQFEKREETGSITLKSLSQIADALDCELIYALRPKKRQRFSEVIWEKLLPQSLEHHWVKSRAEGKKHLALAYIAYERFRNPGIRKQLKLSERTGDSTPRLQL